MNNFIFQYPTKVYFGKGCAKEYLCCLLKKQGDTVLLAYGGGSLKRTGLYDQMTAILNDAGKTVVEFGGIMPNPTYEKVQEGVRLCREHHVDFILAVGGGSVIDCCKIVAAQAVLNEDIWEMEFTKKEYPTRFIPMGCVLTVSGTGSEMNNGAVITHEEKKIKAGVLGAYNTFAMLDPEYTMTVPFRQVMSGAFDTLSHVMETYFGKPHDRNNLSDDFGEAVMRSVIANMRVLYSDHDNYEARSELMWASAMAENGILKIGKVTDFQCHQMEHRLGAYTDCNHGQGLAVLHPVLYRHIYKDGIPKFRNFAVHVWSDESSRVHAEHEDEALRDIELEAVTPENWDSYDVVFVGYPIWWGIAAWPVNGFVKDNDFAGKTVIPFCTSSSSGLGESGTLPAEMAGSGDWRDGQRFSSSADAADVTAWLIQKPVDENATRKLDRHDYRKKYDGYAKRYAALESRMDSPEKERERKGIQYDLFSGFLAGLGETEELPVDFNEKLFHRLVDYATIYPDGRVVFTFRNGAEVGTEI